MPTFCWPCQNGRRARATAIEPIVAFGPSASFASEKLQKWLWSQPVAVPAEPVARLWHAATLLREHRGDGHNAALVAHGVGGTEAHVLMALALGMRAQQFDRIHHLPEAQLTAIVDGLRDRGLVAAAGGFTDAGRQVKERVEARTDELAAPPYDVLGEDELDELIAALEPIAAAVRAGH